jgi:nucleoside-diphosphate-sugar epimerase
MSPSDLPSAFVSDPAGFLGFELVRTLAARGHQVMALARSPEVSELVRRAGGVAIRGDLMEAGAWQRSAAAEWVFHLPPDPLCGSAVNGGAATARDRMTIDSVLLDAIAEAPTKRIVYVTSTSCYGPVGLRPATEEEPPRRAPWSDAITPVLDRLGGYVFAGLPIVTAFCGWMFGTGGWFRDYVISPVVEGRPVVCFGGSSPWISPIHVHDCVRALIHLAERGAAGGRYFVVNRDPVRLHDLAETFARLAGRPLRVRVLTSGAARRRLGAHGAEFVQADAVFSSIRLRGTGFRLLYPTLEDGVRQVLLALRG